MSQCELSVDIEVANEIGVRAAMAPVLGGQPAGFVSTVTGQLSLQPAPMGAR